MTLSPSAVLYRLYADRLRRQVELTSKPGHVGIIMDGNRRWARQVGLADPRLGHRHGARHLDELLRWCEAAGIGFVSVFVCSTENLVRRDDDEVTLLPDRTRNALKAAADHTAACGTGNHLTLAVGYGGRQEVVDAVRDLLHDRASAGATLTDVAEGLTVGDIAAYLYTAGQPEPDLVIRTSGEQRLSNFLLWQSAYSELYFCDAYWPAFREVDFLRALRSYGARQRRFGG